MADSETCANPLLLGWIKEWLDQARERNSKGATVYKKAYESMKACPLSFQHPSEAQQLNGLGPKLCDRLTENLKAYCLENGLPEPEHPQKQSSKRNPREATEEVESQPAKRTRKAKPYVPSLRSGPYALIIGLSSLEEDSSQSLTKAQLIEKAEPYCDTSFTAPSDPTKYFTAWSSMKTLIQKDLVYDHGHPLKRYALTEEGWEVAKRVRQTLPGNSQQNTMSLGDSQATNGTNAESQESGISMASLEPYDDNETQDRDNDWGGDSEYDGPVTPINLPPGSFTVQLVLDNREVRTSKDRDYISNELDKKGIIPEVRSLELGDAMWVAKCHDPAFLSQHGEEGDEVMLDWIVERKRLDDLIGSIKDGRFYEQKFRLRRSGIRNVIYLIEEFSVSNETGSKYQEMVASAIASTQVVNGYFVKQTKNLDDTIRYLTRMTFLLRSMYCAPSEDDTTTTTTTTTTPSTSLNLIPSRQLSSSQSYLDTLERLRAETPSATFAVTFPSFSALTSKSEILTLRDVYLKMLMCTRGVTGEKALEIQRKWPTPQAFVRAFEELQPQDRETMVSEELDAMVGRRKIAKVLSKKIAEVWGEAG
ncbi:DNA repair protein Mus81 [Aspergillus campestris IBT 28561]|uniref:Crossover junction endonuclease MUS81 n=1 Tax=Aspergillus campestris (strain IBT 28561) TaxID=1392248 RepID=A0A2I1DF86_ASPC2|nr:DNA repair protein Mus81 [Aspergillus campestris IBT 28561]PKY08536.1 DNA repair protein Mus81 [Aspergillus campestris IBT 28561]